MGARISFWRDDEAVDGEVERSGPWPGALRQAGVLLHAIARIPRPSRAIEAFVAILALALAGTPLVAAASAPRSLGEIQVAVYGLTARVDPAHPIVPKQTASGIRVVVEAGSRTLTSAEVARLLGGPFELQAELSGPGLSGSLSLPLRGSQAIPSPDPLVLTFPGLPVAGDYDIANIRFVRGGRAVLDAEPRRVTLRVIDQILVTSVVTRPLTLDEIRERGILLGADRRRGDRAFELRRPPGGVGRPLGGGIAGRKRGQSGGVAG